ncbi:lysosomal Pro-X carboxypeptidase isoform X2 [Abrus precatorius]|uniref:Lysosomal Pro-X carboxypeptidase isoform X2 n=1 Tax=Abrus precatorius TaxID=3816 RepID=A0A8B8KRR2_ABRPR|nr:lysosomal Pro-X carboxypeptidase isoform X2 [Abrus precatorius]
MEGQRLLGLRLSTLLVTVAIIVVFHSAQPLALKHAPRFLGKFAAASTKPSEFQQPQFHYETRYFQQRLDHFSFSELPTFPQRYLINTEHWVGPHRMGPIFFYCGNEGDIVWFAENTGFVWEIAPQFGAMVVFPEHRYYGESMPYGSREEAYKNATTLSYLTAEQALADFSVLLIDLKQNFSSKDCPVVLFGGSYGGMLAAWMRLKYPHIAIGALASSAPILQFEDIVPPETFYDIVSNDFRRESSTCFSYIKQSWDEITSTGQTNNGLERLTKTFNLCQQLKRTGDLNDWLESAYSYLAMVNYPYPSEFLMPLPGHPIREVCKRIDRGPTGTSVLERIYEGVNVYYNYTGEAECFKLDDDPHGMSGWNWQACTEMVMPMSSREESSMFPPYEYNYPSFQEECFKNFGVKPRPKWITTEFGGHNIHATLKKFGSNIIFSNGLLDPWSGGSVLQNISESVVSLVTEEGAHHIDLRASTLNDPDWLVEQRETEIKLIEGWINDYYQKNKAIFDM